MSKKGILILVIIIILILLVILFVNKMKEKKEENLTQNSVKTIYEDEEKYIVYDENGEEIYNGTDKAEAEFIERHPDFNPRI